MVRLQRRTEPCTAGKLPKDSGVDGRRGGTYPLPSRGGVYPAGPGSDATWRGGRHGVRSDGRRKGRNDGTGSTRHGAADAMRCYLEMLKRRVVQKTLSKSVEFRNQVLNPLLKK